ncbi:Crp/Fnr family transcriptional regulator [Streptomyces sp. NPDC049916]|uniref:Crp/Fnr family transcriptional regulator n=1 Tax=Streptomyces sp. NPDC049916 TaxID=3155156 RepID=UPI00344AA86D
MKVSAKGTDAASKQPRAMPWRAGTLMAEMTVAGVAAHSLVTLGTPRAYGGGETMIMAGATDTFVLLLLDGFAKVTAVDATGVDVLVDIRAAGDVVGELAAFDGAPRTASVTAVHRVSARRISQREWIGWFTGARDAELAVHRSLAYRSRVSVFRRLELFQGPIAARLARAVMHLGAQYGEQVTEGLLVRPGLTQPEWAELIGGKERSVQKALSRFSEAGAVSRSRGRLIIRSESALAAFAAECGGD